MSRIAAAVDGPRIRSWFDGDALAVIVLCARWCDVCNEFRSSLERIAAERPALNFLWLDIEDDAAVCGDIEVENFPTLAIFRGDQLVHYGTSVPQEGVVARLIDGMARRVEMAGAAPEAVRMLPAALARPHV
jgi:thioredoxin 1